LVEDHPTLVAVAGALLAARSALITELKCGFRRKPPTHSNLMAPGILT
jgi:hypothetical protein